jgi:hypothetical protein
MEKKSIFKSKTFWVNAVASLISVLILVDPELLSIFSVNPEAQVKILTTIGLVTGIANKILRLVTKGPVEIPILKKRGGE